MYPETADLLSFVRQRAEETLRQAENVGDELRTQFAAHSLAILTEVGATLDNGASIGELMATRFLRRIAQDYRDHADYQEEWRLDET